MSARGRAGAATGDVLLVLAVLTLLLTLAYPRISNDRMRRHADAVAADVEHVRGAAVRYREMKGDWPAAGEPGVMPAELAPWITVELDMARDAHLLQWERWEMPPVFGAIAGVTVRTSDPRLLGLLLQRYGEERSFVRDSSWTLVLVGGGDAG